MPSYRIYETNYEKSRFGIHYAIICHHVEFTEPRKKGTAQSPLHIMQDPDAQQWHDRDKAARNRRGTGENRRRSDTPPAPWLFTQQEKPATNCPHSFKNFSENEKQDFLKEKFLKNSYKLEKLEKTWFFLIYFWFFLIYFTRKSNVLTILKLRGYIPPFDFWKIHTQVRNRW